MTLARWAQSRRDRPPEIWTFFGTEWLQLSRTKSDQFWEALTVARWSRAVALRTAVLCRTALPHRRDALDYLAHANMSPQILIQTLEDMVVERVLSPKTARTLEEAVLARTNVHGQWK
jgi:hypothetical protein